MISKQKLIAQIDKFPEDEISIDELIDRLVFIDKLERRTYKSENEANTISEKMVEEEIKKWSK